MIAPADRRLTLDLADLSLHVRTREDVAAPEAPVEVVPAAADLQEVIAAAGEEATTEGHILRPAARPLAEAHVRPPFLRQISTLEDYERDLDEDMAALPDLTPHDLGERYGSRWWTRAGDEVRIRLLDVARRLRLSRLMDSNLMQYARSRGFSTGDEQVRRDLRDGFWSGVDRAHA